MREKQQIFIVRKLFIGSGWIIWWVWSEKTDNPVKISNSKRLINDFKTKNGEKICVESLDSVIFTDPWKCRKKIWKKWNNECFTVVRMQEEAIFRKMAKWHWDIADYPLWIFLKPVFNPWNPIAAVTLWFIMGRSIIIRSFPKSFSRKRRWNGSGEPPILKWFWKHLKHTGWKRR